MSAPVNGDAPKAEPSNLNPNGVFVFDKVDAQPCESGADSSIATAQRGRFA
jgi:hypothetical protein